MFDDSKFVKFSNNDPWFTYIESVKRKKYETGVRDGRDIFIYHYGVNNYIPNHLGITVEVALQGDAFGMQKKYDITCRIPQHLSLHADGIKVIGAPKGKKHMSTSYLKSMTMTMGLQQFG